MQTKIKKEGIYMVKYRDVYDRVLPESKRASDRQNIVLAKIVRPLSIYLTLPLLETNVKATTVTKISVIASLIGFSLLSFGHNMVLNVLGWVCFFAWAVLDCVDGNIARYKDQCSDMGELWDAFGGYVAMVLTYFGGGGCCFFRSESYYVLRTLCIDCSWWCNSHYVNSPQNDNAQEARNGWQGVNKKVYQ